MPKPVGRPNGYLIHAEAFEALVAAKSFLKKQIAAEAEVTPGFLADLLAHRSGASRQVVARLAGALGVRDEALFPELAGWIGPLPDRSARRDRSPHEAVA